MKWVSSCKWGQLANPEVHAVVMYSEFNCCRVLEEASRRHSAELRDLQEKLGIERLLCFWFIVALRFFLYVPVYMSCYLPTNISEVHVHIGGHLYLGVMGSWGESLYPRTQ